LEHVSNEINYLRAGSVELVKHADFNSNLQVWGSWSAYELSADNKRLLWIPPGFAHGFVLTSETAEFLYKATDYGYPEHERSLLWCDPTVGIQWPVDGAPILAAKDAAGKVLAEADAFA
jgi:dTDP-4-dehydrorhamnose 3,5-epimerase